MNWLARRCNEMEQGGDFHDAGPAADMTAPWRRLLTVEDLFPLAQLALFVMLPPPLGSLAWALLGVLAIVIGLQVWHRYRRGTADAG